MSGARPVAPVLLAALALTACAAPRALGARLAEVERLAQASREGGAYRCAPEELALATAHLEFAHLELAQGDLTRAREHLVLADANARAAVTLSAQPSCAQAGTDAPETRVAVTSGTTFAEAAHALRPPRPRHAAHPRSIYAHARS